MTPTSPETRTGFRLTLRQASLAILLIALALAPIAEALKSPTTEQIILAFVVELYGMPMLITLILSLGRKPWRQKARTIVLLWRFMALVYVAPLVLFIVLYFIFKK